MSSTFHTSTSLLFVLFLVLIPHCQSQSTQDNINSICGRVDDYYFCRDVFNQNLYTPNLDVKGLAQITLTQTLINATNTQIFIKKAETNEKRSDVLKLYKTCDAHYGSLQDKFVNANLAFGRDDLKDVAVQVNSCDRFVNDCLSGVGSSLPELQKQNNENLVLVQMSIISANNLIGQ